MHNVLSAYYLSVMLSGTSCILESFLVEMPKWFYNDLDEKFIGRKSKLAKWKIEIKIKKLITEVRIR